MAHIRQSKPDYCLGFQAEVLKACKGAVSSLGSGTSDQKPRLSSLGALGVHSKGPTPGARGVVKLPNL